MVNTRLLDSFIRHHRQASCSTIDHCFNLVSSLFTLKSIRCYITFSFTIHFDTTYACQDRRDDVKAGIKSAAVLASAHVHLLCTAFSATAVTCLAIAGSNNGQGFLFYTALIGGAAQLVWQIRTLDLNNEAICGKVAWVRRWDF